MTTDAVALMFREVSPSEWLTKQCAAIHVDFYKERGWTVLIEDADIRDQAIVDTYQVEIVQWDIRRRER